MDEYMVDYVSIINNRDTRKLQDALNLHAKNGWEFCGFTSTTGPSDGLLVYVLKRKSR
jgi:hypothetical protein